MKYQVVKSNRIKGKLLGKEWCVSWYLLDIEVTKKKGQGEVSIVNSRGINRFIASWIASEQRDSFCAVILCTGAKVLLNEYARPQTNTRYAVTQ